MVLESRGAWQLGGQEVRHPKFPLEEVQAIGILERLHQLKSTGSPSF